MALLKHVPDRDLSVTKSLGKCWEKLSVISQHNFEEGISEQDAKPRSQKGNELDIRKRFNFAMRRMLGQKGKRQPICSRMIV